MAHRDLTPDEMEAVSIYAAEQGRHWKAKLEYDWYFAMERYHGRANAGLLQRIRNDPRLGWEWLVQFRLPKSA